MEKSADYTDYADFVGSPKASRENKVNFLAITVFFTPAYNTVSNRNLRILNTIPPVCGS
jgi:hypothetical protein